MRDKEVIDAADEKGLAMVFTGMRHFGINCRPERSEGRQATEDSLADVRSFAALRMTKGWRAPIRP